MQIIASSTDVSSVRQKACNSDNISIGKQQRIRFAASPVVTTRAPVMSCAVIAAHQGLVWCRHVRTTHRAE
jgi:hypothetical protein